MPQSKKQEINGRSDRRDRSLQDCGYDRQACKTYRQAASALEASGETDNVVLAETYLALMAVHFHRSRHNKDGARNMKKAIAWYDKAIEVYRQRADVRDLSANLTNMSALLFQAGQFDRAVEVAKEGLDIAETLDDPHGHFRLPAWNHYATYCRQVGKLDEAEKTLKRGLNIIGKVHASGFLIETLAGVYEERAQQLRQEASQLMVCDASCGSPKSR